MIQIDNKLLVKLPEGAKNKRILDMSYTSVHTKPTLFWDIGNFSDNKILPPGSWEIVGETKSITEEQAEKLVNRFYDFDGIPGWDDKNGGIWSKAKDAFISLMKANKVPLEDNFLILIKK